MLTHKPCKWCGSMWHSKNKCEQRQISPFKPVYKKKGNNTSLDTQSPSERPILAYKGDSERSQAIGYADKFFSTFIRTRGGDGSRNWCYTCGTRLNYEDLQCGHFISRRFTNTRWHEINCHPQCNTCNVDKHGNLKVYELRLRAEYGDALIDGMKQLAHSGDKFTLADINEVINKYKGVAF